MDTGDFVQLQVAFSSRECWHIHKMLVEANIRLFGVQNRESFEVLMINSSVAIVGLSDTVHNCLIITCNSQ